MNTGYGHSLLAADATDLLVSFEEFSKKPDQQLAVTWMAPSYTPKANDENDLPVRPHRGPQ